MAGAYKKVELVTQIVVTLSDAEARELRFYLSQRRSGAFSPTGGHAVTNGILDAIKAAQN